MAIFGSALGPSCYKATSGWGMNTTGTASTTDATSVYYVWTGWQNPDPAQTITTASSFVWDQWTTVTYDVTWNPPPVEFPLRLPVQENQSRVPPENKALELLGELVGPKRLALYKKTGKLVVWSDDYRYTLCRDGSVERKAKREKVKERLCIAIGDRYACPPTDNVIGLYCAIKADEAAFNQEANVIGRAA